MNITEITKTASSFGNWVFKVGEKHHYFFTEKAAIRARNAFIAQGPSMAECFQNKFHPHLPQCKAAGEFLRAAIGNPTDNWTWCAEHVGNTEVPENNTGDSNETFEQRA
jgi:hypothetical protein